MRAKAGRGAKAVRTIAWMKHGSEALGNPRGPLTRTSTEEKVSDSKGDPGSTGKSAWVSVRGKGHLMNSSTENAEPEHVRQGAARGGKRTKAQRTERRVKKKAASRKRRDRMKGVTPEEGDMLFVVAAEDQRVLVSGKDVGTEETYHTWIEADVINKNGLPTNRRTTGFIMPLRHQPLIRKDQAARCFLYDEEHVVGSMVAPRVSKGHPGVGYVTTDDVSHGNVHGNSGIKPKPCSSDCPQGGDRTFARTRVLMANLRPESILIRKGEILGVLHVTEKRTSGHGETKCSADVSEADGSTGRVPWKRVASLTHAMAESAINMKHESREPEYENRREELKAKSREYADAEDGRKRQRGKVDEKIWAAARRYQKLMTSTGIFSRATADGDFEQQLRLSRLVWE
jgi:hypothetical protein